jgi:large subunit ribosomal protein L13e
MVKSNNIVPNVHLRKQWQYRVRLNFNLPAKRKARKTARLQKAARIFPRPTSGPLRPAVRISTVKHNNRLRAGRGFTPLELKTAGIPVQFARTVGIAVDTRRKNLSEESLQQNVQRLKEYQSKLILFPRDSSKPKKGPIADTQGDALKKATQVSVNKFPVENNWTNPEPRVIEDKERKHRAFKTLRRAKKQVRSVGYLFKKRRAAAEEKQSTQGSKKAEK